MEFKSGFVAVVGKPNVGKSSLVNALVGEKVSITSPKAQTTRNRIFGIKNGADYQIVFVDTPGVQHTKTKLGEYMSKATDGATADVDAIVIVLDAVRIGQEDYKIIEKYEKVKCPIFLVINKIELTNFEKMYPILSKLNEYKFIKKFITTSAIRKLNISELESDLVECLPEGEAYYPRDEYTDKSVRFMCGEIIREKALLYLQEEIPHGIAVEIINFSEGKSLIKIDANIITENSRHKQIIIGKNGDMLKRIGIASREDIENLTSTKVMIELFVKVKKDWKDDASALNDLGFNKKDI
ncbi:MAG: GTPase Era [Clostridia bacterium]|nr:GTPase Era [Clostridia bacterium]